MSITTLKRKSAAKYGRHSTSNGFSLNNSRRVEAHTNQVQTQTPFIGTAAKGYGGTYGEYTKTINKTQYNNMYDPFNAGRPTVLSNHALISKKLRPLLSGFPNNIVQPTFQTDYESLNNQKVAGLSHTIQDSGNCINTKKSGTYHKVMGPMDYSTYMSTRLKNNKCLAPPKLTYPPRIQRNNFMGCYQNITYEQYKETNKSCADIAAEAAA